MPSSIPTPFYPQLLAFFGGDVSCVTGIPARIDPPYLTPLVPHPISTPREFLLVRFAEVLEHHIADQTQKGEATEAIEMSQELVSLIQEWMMQYGSTLFYQETNDELPLQRIWKTVGRYCRLLSAIEHIRSENLTPVTFTDLRLVLGSEA